MLRQTMPVSKVIASLYNELWSMELRSFGRGVQVSVLGVGCSRVGSISNPVSMREVRATLEAAIDAGVNLFDTADVYGQGDSERLLVACARDTATECSWSLRSAWFAVSSERYSIR